MIVDRYFIQNRFLRIAIVLFPIVFLGLSELLRLAHWNTYVKLAMEDGILEWSEAFVLFLSFLLASSIAIGFARERCFVLTATYCLFSLMFIFGCIEEISWGQRFLDFDTPAFFQQYNRQEEANIHNLLYVQEILTVLFNTAVLFYFGSAWLWVSRNMALKYPSSIHYLVPSCLLTPYFTMHLLYWYVFPPQAGWWAGKRPGQTFEIDEFLIYLGFLLFMLMSKVRQKNREMYLPEVLS